MTPAELQAKKLAEYLDELAKVKDSLMSTCNDLVKDPGPRRPGRRSAYGPTRPAATYVPHSPHWSGF